MPLGKKLGLTVMITLTLACSILWVGKTVVGNGLPLLTVNPSHSMAPGLYLQTPRQAPGVGDVVGLNVPVHIRPFVHAHGGGFARVLKRVRAVEGARVCMSPAGVFVEGKRLVDLPDDIPSQYRNWPDACRILKSGEVFLLGDFDDPGPSFDSRFFGLVRIEEIRRYVRVY